MAPNPGPQYYENTAVLNPQMAGLQPPRGFPRNMPPRIPPPGLARGIPPRGLRNFSPSPPGLPPGPPRPHPIMPHPGIPPGMPPNFQQGILPNVPPMVQASPQLGLNPVARHQMFLPPGMHMVGMPPTHGQIPMPQSSHPPVHPRILTKASHSNWSTSASITQKSEYCSFHPWRT